MFNLRPALILAFAGSVSAGAAQGLPKISPALLPSMPVAQSSLPAAPQPAAPAAATTAAPVVTAAPAATAVYGPVIVVSPPPSFRDPGFASPVASPLPVNTPIFIGSAELAPGAGLAQPTAVVLAAQSSYRAHGLNPYWARSRRQMMELTSWVKDGSLTQAQGAQFRVEIKGIRQKFGLDSHTDASQLNGDQRQALSKALSDESRKIRDAVARKPAQD